VLAIEEEDHSGQAHATEGDVHDNTSSDGESLIIDLQFYNDDFYSKYHEVSLLIDTGSISSVIKKSK